MTRLERGALFAAKAFLSVSLIASVNGRRRRGPHLGIVSLWQRTGACKPFG